MKSLPDDKYQIPTSQETFTYLMRDDTHAVIEGFTLRASAMGIQFSDDQLLELKQAYQEFIKGLMVTYEETSGDRNTIVEIVDANDVNAIRNHKLETFIGNRHEDFVVVTMDPLCDFPGTISFAVSRLFDPQGLVSEQLTNRPGSDTISHQIRSIQQAAQGKKIILVEDDLFSGSTIQRTMDLFRGLGLNGSEANVEIVALFPGIQALSDTPLAIKEDLLIDPVYTIEIVPGLNTEDVLDIGDPRDFLVGGDGLVTEVGRQPYVLPFVSPSARATVPEENEVDFSHRVLELTERFYQAAEQITGVTWNHRFCEPAAQQGIEYHGYATSESSPSMVDVVSSARSRLNVPAKAPAEVRIDLA